MADYTVVVRAAYRSNVAQGLRTDAGAIQGLAATVERSTNKATSSTARLAAMSAVAGKILAVGIGGVLAVSTRAAIEFESSMAEVAKTTDMAGNSFDRSSGPLFSFGQAIRNLALRTPVDASDLAELAGMGGQLGIEVPNLIKFTEVMAALGVSTNMSSMEAAKGMARFANIMRTPQDEFDRLGSVIVRLGNNLATTESEILKFATRIAPVGRIVRATEEEVFALAGALTSLGVPAERGGTALQKWFILAKTAVDSGSASLEEFGRVAGMSGDEFAKLFRETPGQAFHAFVTGLDNISQSGQNVFDVLSGLGLAEVRTTQVLLAAAGGAEVLGDALAMAADEGHKVNAMWEEAARRYGTTESQIRLLSNSFNDLRMEVGNMVLSGGMLHTLVQILREFFGLVKDNLPVVGALGLALGGLAVLRLIPWVMELGSKFMVAARAMKSASDATKTLSQVQRIAQASSAALSLAMGAVATVGGILVTIWASMAIKSAELKVRVAQLNDELKGGVSAGEAFGTALSKVVSDKQRRQLADMGIGWSQFVDWVIRGKDETSELGKRITEALTPVGTWKDRNGGIATVWGVLSREGEILAGILERVDGEMSAIMSVRRLELTNALLEAGHSAWRTSEQIESLVDEAIKLFGVEVPVDMFVEWVKQTDNYQDHILRRWANQQAEVKKMERVYKAFGLVWADALGIDDMDERSAAISRFFEGIADTVQKYGDSLADEFKRVGDTVTSGFPTWDEEYEKMVISPTTYRKILKSQEQFLTDTEAWIKRMPSIMDMGASIDTVGWIESLSTPTRGAIARLNDEQLEELISGANRNFDELHRLHLLRWMQIYPESQRAGFAAMVGELVGNVDTMNLWGQDYAFAFGDGLATIMKSLPETEQQAFLGYLKELLNNPEWMEAMGIESIAPWIAGLISELSKLASKVRPTLTGQMNDIKNQVNRQWAVESPSKWWQHLGEQFVAGFQIGLGGMGDVLNQFTPQLTMPVMSAASGSMSSVTNNRTNNVNLSVSGVGNGVDMNAEAQTLLTLLTIVGGIEGGAGR